MLYKGWLVVVHDGYRESDYRRIPCVNQRTERRNNLDAFPRVFLADFMDALTFWCLLQELIKAFCFLWGDPFCRLCLPWRGLPRVVRLRPLAFIWCLFGLQGFIFVRPGFSSIFSLIPPLIQKALPSLAVRLLVPVLVRLPLKVYLAPE